MTSDQEQLEDLRRDFERFEREVERKFRHIDVVCRKYMCKTESTELRQFADELYAGL